MCVTTTFLLKRVFSYARAMHLYASGIVMWSFSAFGCKKVARAYKLVPSPTTITFSKSMQCLNWWTSPATFKLWLKLVKTFLSFAICAPQLHWNTTTQNCTVWSWFCTLCLTSKSSCSLGLRNWCCWWSLVDCTTLRPVVVSNRDLIFQKRLHKRNHYKFVELDIGVFFG